MFPRKINRVVQLQCALTLVLAAGAAYGQACAAGQGQVIVTPSSGALSITLDPTGISPAANLTFTAITNMSSGGNKLYVWAYFPSSTALTGQSYSADAIPTSAVYAQHGNNGSYQFFSAGGPDPWGDTNAVQVAQVNGVGKGCQTFTATLSIEIDLTKLSTAPRAQTYTGTVYVRAQVH